MRKIFKDAAAPALATAAATAVSVTNATAADGRPSGAVCLYAQNGYDNPTTPTDVNGLDADRDFHPDFTDRIPLMMTTLDRPQQQIQGGWSELVTQVDVRCRCPFLRWR